MKRASVSDVARAAGVSTATVSRVINSPDRVSESTRVRVQKAIDDLAYIRSATAISFKEQQTRNVLVLVANIGNIYYSEMFQGLQDRAEAQGYSIIIATPPRARTSREVADRLRSGRVDGIVMLDGIRMDGADYRSLESFYGGTPPLVGFAERRGVLSYPHAYVDNRAAAYAATKYLIDHGHRDIGYLVGPPGYAASGERLRGFRRAMDEARLPIRPDWVIQAGFETSDGRAAARELLARGALPTAMATANDQTAMGLIAECSEKGMVIPRDLSVVGFDDNVLASSFVPALTTIYQPRNQIGAVAMDLLLEVIRSPQSVSAERVEELETRIVERLSVSAPRAT